MGQGDSRSQDENDRMREIPKCRIEGSSLILRVE